jgi:hypothetical protein
MMSRQKSRETRLAFGHDVQTEKREMEETMLKKIRCFYWSRRDRGKGRQFIVTTTVAFICLVLLFGVTVKSLITSRQKVVQVHMETGVSGGAYTDTSVITESAISEEKETGTQAPLEEHTQAPVEQVTDTSGLDAFYGFMTEEAYAVMEEKILAECEKRQCNSAKKLNYQQTSEGSFDVASFILLSDGSIFRCDYNLKSGAVSVSQTEYSEADITAMHNAEVKAEQKKVERQQAADRKKVEKNKSKTQGKKKADKNKSRKKTSGKKAGKHKKSQKKTSRNK